MSITDWQMSLSDRSTHFKLSAWCHHISAGLYQTEYIIYVCMCVNVLYILIFYKTPPFDNYAGVPWNCMGCEKYSLCIFCITHGKLIPLSRKWYKFFKILYIHFRQTCRNKLIPYWMDEVRQPKHLHKHFHLLTCVMWLYSCARIG
jgi:hypothetical protein